MLYDKSAILQVYYVTSKGKASKIVQDGTELSQAQLKLELELCFTSFKICCIKLIKLVKLDLVW